MYNIAVVEEMPKCGFGFVTWCLFGCGCPLRDPQRPGIRNVGSASLGGRRRFLQTSKFGKHLKDTFSTAIKNYGSREDTCGLRNFPDYSNFSFAMLPLLPSTLLQPTTLQPLKRWSVKSSSRCRGVSHEGTPRLRVLDHPPKLKGHWGNTIGKLYCR